MGLIDSLFGSPLQRGIDQGLDFLYGGRPTAGPGGIAGPMAQPPGIPDVGISETGALGGAPYNANDIVVEGFKPKKRSFLGFLADAYLMSKGGKPLFAERIDRKNVDKALRGYADNPLDAIRRLGQIHGHGEDAVNLHDKYSDNIRADATQQRILGKDNDSRLKSISGLAGVALSNPANRADAIRQYNSRLSAWGLLDQYALPDDISDAELQSIYMGVLPADKQERVKYQKQRIEQLEKDTNSKIEDRSTDNAQAATNEAGRNNRNAVNEAGRNNRNAVNEAGRNARKNSDGSKTIMTPGGRQMTISPSGLTAVVTEPDGTKHVVEKFGNGWKLRKK